MPTSTELSHLPLRHSLAKKRNNAIVAVLSGGPTRTPAIPASRPRASRRHETMSSNLDFSVGKRFPLAESRALEFHADFFTLLNHPNRDNPVSDIGTADFGKVLSFSSSPRLVQFALKFTF